MMFEWEVCTNQGKCTTVGYLLPGGIRYGGGAFLPSVRSSSSSTSLNERNFTGEQFRTNRDPYWTSRVNSWVTFHSRHERVLAGKDLLKENGGRNLLLEDLTVHASAESTSGCCDDESAWCYKTEVIVQPLCWWSQQCYQNLITTSLIVKTNIYHVLK